MKKFKILLCLLCLFLLVGCTNKSKESKEVVSINGFENAGNNNGFNITDNTSSYADVDYVLEARAASLDDATVEMVVYTDIENAKKVQDDQIEKFKKIKNTATPLNKEEGENYYKFWMVSNGYYMVSSRVDNTLIFCKTLLKNKEKVEAILNDLGY